MKNAVEIQEEKHPQFLIKNIWERSTDSCTEYIYFKEDGGFGYYCSCGNPIEDSDLYEEYSYDESTGVITIIGDDVEIYADIISYDDKSIVINMPKGLEKGKKTFTVSEEN